MGLYKVKLDKPPLALSGRFRSVATKLSASACATPSRSLLHLGDCQPMDLLFLADALQVHVFA